MSFVVVTPAPGCFLGVVKNFIKARARTRKSLRALLLLIGVAPADVDRYKSASFRKFLPHIARARGVPNQARNEIGLCMGRQRRAEGR